MELTINYFQAIKLSVSKKWIIVTVLVLAASGVMIRLGIWQLDRLEGRRAFNAQVLSQRDQPPFVIDQNGVHADLASMEFRSVEAVGEFDYSNQILLGNQGYEDRLGVHLLTPLRIDGSESYILIDRGWVPYEDVVANDLEKHNETGTIKVSGILRASQGKVGLKNCVDENNLTVGSILQIWCVDLGSIEQQLSYQLLDSYVWQTPVGEQTSPPYRSQLNFEISEGPHLGYAIQWFTFTALLIIGYPFFIRKEVSARKNSEARSSDRQTDQMQESVREERA